MHRGLPGPGDLLDKFNPFGIAGDVAGKAVADGWTGIMMALWKSGLWVLRFVLNAMDQWMTPDISENGPASELYRTTFWAAGSLVLIMAFVQVGAAAFRRDGKSLGRLVVGTFQFIGVWAAGITYGVGVIAACSGLTKALMESMLKVNNFSEWNPTADPDLGKGGVEVGLATVLGILALFLWIAAIGHFIIMLTRSAALLILAAFSSVAAAGLVSDFSRSWLWKTVRWFHAAALTPVLVVIMLGLGVQLTSGVAAGNADSAQAAVGTALPGVMVILISVVAPMALFKLLAFVDPGTSSGASMRAGMQSAGGIGGLLGGGGKDGGSSTASQSSGSGQSQGEAQSTEATSKRFGTAMGNLGGVGGAYGAALTAVAGVGAKAASVGMDSANQMGVGDSSYTPDYQRGSQRFNPDQRDGTSENDPADPNGPGDTESGSAPTAPTPGLPTTPGGGQHPGGAAAPPATSGGQPGGGGAAKAGGGGAASKVPPVA